MKKHINFPKVLTILIVFSIAFVSCKEFYKKQKSSIVVVSGQIINATGDSAWVEVYKAVGRDRITYGDKLNKNGSFNIRFEIHKPQMAVFNDGNEITRMFIQPGDSLYLTLNTEEFDETIKYSGKGASENNYMAAKYMKFDDTPAFPYWKLVDSLPAMEYNHHFDSIKIERMNFLNEYISNNPASNDFISFEKTNIEFEYADNIYMFIQHHIRANNYKLDTINVPATFYTIVDSYLDYNDPYKLSIEYSQYLADYLSYIAYANQNLLSDKETKDSIYLSLIINKLDGYSKEKALSHHFFRKLDGYNIDYYKLHKNVFDEHVPDKDLREVIYDKYISIKELLKKELPEGAKLKNLESPQNSEFSFNRIIEQYKGKVIYVDFWASWCGPCKHEMPFSLKLQEKFKDKYVVFLFFSTDKDSVAWKQMIKILQITGDHYRLNKAARKEIDSLFNVRFIPRYVIIDKNGKVIDDKAKRPSNEEVVKEINALL
ncbi:MAG: TlpA family protein disulfide reductase [Bacteroidales bacterium]|nr:TlpA family protein disulfide reductase [Bacteroidales bacterium]